MNQSIIGLVIRRSNPTLDDNLVVVCFPSVKPENDFIGSIFAPTLARQQKIHMNKTLHLHLLHHL
jgi:hypothetical protein